MHPTPTTTIEFHFKDKKGNQKYFHTTYAHARLILVDFLEQLKLDEITDLYYTASNSNISHKLDYYNTEI